MSRVKSPKGLARVDAFCALLDEYQMSPDDYDEGVEEDPRPFVAANRRPDRFVCVTANYSQHGWAKVFFLPTFSRLEDAQARAVEYAEDDVFEEVPVEVRDLDTGESFRPVWSGMQWRRWTK